MDIDYGKRAMQRKRGNQLGRPRSGKARDEQLKQQVHILADRLALAVCMLRMPWLGVMTYFDLITLMRGWATDLLDPEPSSRAAALAIKFDEVRKTDLYKSTLNHIRGMLRRQLLDGADWLKAA